MLKKIIGTTSTRILNAFSNLIILWLLANFIGSKGLGIIGLIVVDISIIQLSTDLLAGGSLIYFASRTNLGKLMIPAYLYSIIVIVFFYIVSRIALIWFPGLFYTIVPEGYFFHVLALSFLGSLNGIHYNLLLGKERVTIYNIFFTIQSILLVVSTAIFIFVLNNKTVTAYLSALYISLGISALSGFIAVIAKADSMNMKGWFSVTKQVLKFGIVSQIANLLSIGNNRLGYYFIRYYFNLSVLGIYNAGVQLTEGLKLIGQSIAVVQFSTISNTRDHDYARTLSIRLMKISVLLTFVALVILIILPESVYTSLFSNELIGIKSVVIALSPGVLALSMNNIFSHYFSGMGNPKINLFAKIAGLVITITLAFILIPLYGIIGAAATASFSYVTTVVYQYIIFRKQTGTKFAEWIPEKADWIEFKSILRQAIRREDK